MSAADFGPWRPDIPEHERVARQITGGPHDVVPGAAFALQQAGDVIEGPPQLRRKVADVNAHAVLVNGSGAEISG